MNDIVVGLGFGDEGKGTTVDYLCATKDVNAVVRFSGGPQTAHNVITPDGKHHTFAQFGSGTFHGVPTILSKFMLVNPLNMVKEADHLASLTRRDPFEITSISENSLLITPIHRAANQRREINRGAAAHGSCGQGIGEAMAFAVQYPFDAPRVGEMRTPEVLAWKLNQYRRFVESELGELDVPSVDEIVSSFLQIIAERPVNIVDDEAVLAEVAKGHNVFEGSQGVLLDEWLGFHPHTTWSTTTAQNAQTLLAQAGQPRGRVLGITRTYTTRHGYGPFPSEFAVRDWDERFPEAHNGTGRFQGAWRAGLLDLHLLDYAVAATQGVDEIVLTHCDIKVDEVVAGYDNLGAIVPSFKQNLVYQESLANLLNRVKGNGRRVAVHNEDDVVDMLSARLNAPVTVRSYGPTHEDKKVKA